MNWSGTVASGGTSRSCVGSSTATRGASSLLTRTSNRTTSWLANPSVSFSSIQNGCDSSATNAVAIDRPPSPIETGSLAAASPRRRVAEAIALLARARARSGSPRPPGPGCSRRQAPGAGARCRRGRPRGRPAFPGPAAGRPRRPGRGDVVAGLDGERNGLATDSIRPRKVPSSVGRRGSVAISPSG